MTKQYEMFSGAQLKTNGTQKVLSHNQAWASLVQAVIRSLALTQATFTAEDLRNACAASGVPLPVHHNAWGAAISKAAQAGIIRHVGYRKNHLASAHARVVGVWSRNTSTD